MDSLRSVVKVEIDSSEPCNVRGIFSACGEIRALYPYQAGVPRNSHFFIQFENEQSAERAIGFYFNNPDIRAYSVAMHPRYLAQYSTVNLSTSNTTTEPRNTHTSVQRHHNSPRHAKKTQDRGVSLHPFHLSPSHHNPERPSVSQISPGTGPFFRTLRSSETSILSDNSHKVADSLSTSEIILPAETSSQQMIASPDSIKVSPQINSTQPSTPTELLFSLESRISLSFCGETISLDLQSLGQDPQAIIQLLKTTSSERGSWMIVGAYYRRSGNAKAAIAVVEAMIEVMAEHNVSQVELKPAFLILSGCETDLGKRARLSKPESTDSVEHYKKSEKWLQKVYGTCVSTEIRPPPLLLPSLNAQVPEGYSQFSLGTGLNKSLKEPTMSNNDTPVNYEYRKTSSSMSDRCKKLEREISFLRNRHDQEMIFTSKSRIAKRELEDDYLHERDVRRRLQRQLEVVERERDEAKRMEDHALEQVKREVESRRKAEEAAAREREMRLEQTRAPGACGQIHDV